MGIEAGTCKQPEEMRVEDWQLGRKEGGCEVSGLWGEAAVSWCAPVNA